MEKERKTKSMDTHLLEINLISAQGLKIPSAKLRRLQTYALAWVNPTTKLRTRVDIVGGENPTWNDKFIFRVSQDFLSSDTSAVSVEIYVVGYLKDSLIGTVRFLVGNCLSPSLVSSSPETVVAGIGIPCFVALQIRRPSGRFHGVLNLGAMLINTGLDLLGLTGFSAIGYRDMMGHPHHHRLLQRQHRRRDQSNKSNDEQSDSCDNSCADSGDCSDAESSSASSTSTSSTVLQELNGGKGIAVLQELNGKRDMSMLQELNGRKDITEDAKENDLVEMGGPLCGLGFQRKKNHTNINLSQCCTSWGFGRALV